MSRSVISVFVRTGPEPVAREFRDGLTIDRFCDPRASTLDANFEPIYQTCGVPPQAALDFALFASSVYVADKKVLRREQADAWTRYYHISVPAYDLNRWRPVSQQFAKVLSFLTGDVWRVSVRPSDRWMVQPGLQLISSSTYDVVCLFSGGLDSAIGAVNLLESGKRVLLIGHYDNNHTKNDQVVVFEQLTNLYPSGALDLLQIRVRPALKSDSQEKSLPSVTENTVRSRSIVFLSIALLAASAISQDTNVFMPENGYISLNIPLTPPRRGSSSTRTTHPHFLDGVTSLLSAIGLCNPIRNPFSALTKGEIVQMCANKNTLRNIARSTISCAHPEVLRFVKQPRRNCGYCYPCLVRRAALHMAGMDDPRDYGWDVCKDADLIKHSKRGKDARAMFLSLNEAKRSKQTLLSLASGGPMNKPVAELEKLRRVYVQGLSEIERLFVEKATPEVLRLAGLQQS